MWRVELENVVKTFAGHRREVIHALAGVTLAVESGELVVLAGPSGCGKTTLLRLIAGLDQPDSGTIRIGGKVMDDTPAGDREVAMVFQQPALLPHLSARENIEFGLKLRRCDRPEIARRLDEARETLALGDWLERKPEFLSAGQRQRVALARAIVRRPKVLLLDEPLSNLDGPLRARMRLELARLNARLGATMLCVTHDQEEALALGRRVAVMREGRILQTGSPDTVYRQPADLFVARFLGSPPMNCLPGRIAPARGGLVFQFDTGDAAKPNGPSVPLPRSYDGAPTGQELVLGIRPENVVLNGSQPALRAEIEAVGFAGPSAVVHLRMGPLEFEARAPAGQSWEPGTQVAVGIPMEEIHLFDPATGQRISRS